MSNCELVLLEDEVNPVISVALKSGLDVTGLGPAALSMQPTLFAVNLNAEGGIVARRRIPERVR
jgi:hypothetical protein